MTKPETKREALERRKQELEFLGTQFAMSGCEPPKELGEEYARILAELARPPTPTTELPRPR
ncbi:hypothetical protein L6R52_42295 [Myxococcota bacterium]|nr:hypothetical protein [Myxococcota bacterium]